MHPSPMAETVGPLLPSLRVFIFQNHPLARAKPQAGCLRTDPTYPRRSKMSRPFSRIKLGYYPLPIEEAQNIRAMLMSSAPYATIDPCAGEGTALLEITRNTDAHLATIELDADRAEAAYRNGVATVHGSAFECRVPAETCSLLYLNPPYDNEFGPHSNKRMELVFLEHTYRWVTSEGVLVFVVPAPAVGTCARLLTSQFDRLSVFRLEHPESIRFNQVVVFGRRKKTHLRGEPKGTDDLLRIAYKPQLLPVLNQEVVERYAIPPSSPATVTYTGLPLDGIEDALQRSVAMQNARGILVRKQQKMSGRPVTPVHRPRWSIG